MLEKIEVVITGLGVVSPIGLDVATFWEALIGGHSGVSKITRLNTTDLPIQIGAEVKNFDPLLYMDRKTAQDTDIFIHYAIAAARQAIEDAGGLHQVDPYKIGVSIGTSVGGIGSLLDGQKMMELRGPSRVSPRLFTKFIPNMAAYQIASIFGAAGPNKTITTACASSNDAFGEAMRQIQSGEADMVIAGGADSMFIPVMLAGLATNGAASQRNDEPHKASRPFDHNRDGMVVGEGSGMVVIESRRHAEKRGVRIYCELAGYASNGEGYHPAAPSPDGRGEARAMAEAIARAGIPPEKVNYVSAHGTSTPLGDEVETKAIKHVFGAHSKKLLVSSIKGHTGHLLGASGAVELIAAVKALETGLVPPTINYETPDPKCDLDYVPNKARQADIQIALSNSFGFGGQNASVVIKKFELGGFGYGI